MALNPLIIDTHSHIFDTAFDPDRTEVIERALSAGVGLQLLPNVDLDTVPALLRTADQYACCLPMIGLHPTSVGERFESDLSELERIMGQHRFYGIGEIGIDLYWDTSMREQQEQAFRHQLRWAKRMHLPVSIHVRDRANSTAAFDTVLAIVDAEHTSELSGVFHCFSGTFNHYRHIADYGTFMVGIGGVATYKNGGFDQLAPHIDPAHLLLETDCPYLAPIPKRGKRNEPAHIVHTATHIAQLLKLEVADLYGITSSNAIRLFNLTLPEQQA